MSCEARRKLRRNGPDITLVRRSQHPSAGRIRRRRWQACGQPAYL